jgi:hypothetical protein
MRERIFGDYEEMMNKRKKELPTINKSILEVMKGYDGEMIAIIRVHEDENGDVMGRSIFVGGVGKMEAGGAIVEGCTEIVSKVTDNMTKDLDKQLKVIGNDLIAELKKIMGDK